MYEFFKLMHSIAETNPKEYKSIKDLTIDIAYSGGYRRESVNLLNGKEVIRTKYNIPSTWDNTLVAKWFCYFEKLFTSKLGQHPELSEFHTQIIQRTFTIYFNALQVDKIFKDSNVLTVVYTCLANRIGEVLILKGSEERLKRYHNNNGINGVRKSTDRISMKHAINHMAVSLDSFYGEEEELQLTDKSAEQSDLILELRNRLANISIGHRVLESLVYTNSKISLNKVLDYLKLTKEEKEDPQIAEDIKSSLEVIMKTIKEYYPNYSAVMPKLKKLDMRNCCKKVADLI